MVGFFVKTGRQRGYGSPTLDQRPVVSGMDLLCVVEMFLRESMIQGGALGAIPFGKAGAMRRHIVVVHERLEV